MQVRLFTNRARHGGGLTEPIRTTQEVNSPWEPNSGTDERMLPIREDLSLSLIGKGVG
ncbi:hypothetical protein [Scytonema sp. HK-05]|uniref:hypothetical protein n=1 Tax=Scytonema sp. HK-05 TaxID=1137095 RepID=UPI001E2DD82D|nr:hypothetical protein [Scytonema sp. HK-05]